jgi:hypothetical protein
MRQNGSSRTPRVGTRVELARYTLTGGERTIYSQLIDGFVRVIDRPAGGPGRSYLVERGLKSDSHSALMALVADYTSQAERLDEIPIEAGLLRGSEEVELARYSITGGERILYGERIDGVVRVTDRPAVGPSGRSYHVERGLERDGYLALKALVADYIRRARKRDEIPMAARVVRRTAALRSAPDGPLALLGDELTRAERVLLDRPG